jgi:ABC-type sugar transport system ATPase subunit
VLLALEGVLSARVRGVDLTLHRGEVVGIAGLVGAGRTELARLIFGADRRTGGRMTVEGRPVDPRSPREAIDLGIGLLTEDRDGLGLIAPMNVRENATLAALSDFRRGPFVAKRREREAVRGLASRLRIKTRSIESAVSELSGGNRQKVVLARWLATRSKILIFDEPTAGVDVGARHEIHALIDTLSGEGRGVIVISSDLDELLSIADRIVVMREGRIAGELSASEATREKVMTLATTDPAYPATA